MAFLCQKMRFLKNVIIKLLYDTHPRWLINRTKLHICTSSNFGRIEVFIHTKYAIGRPSLDRNHWDPGECWVSHLQ